jgi:hypothetical protein
MKNTMQRYNIYFIVVFFNQRILRYLFFINIYISQINTFLLED